MRHRRPQVAAFPGGSRVGTRGVEIDMWRHGLPNPAAFGRLVYNRAADSLAASMTVRGGDGTPFEAIYARRAEERAYRGLDLGGPGLSFTDLTTCLAGPEIVFNRWIRRDGLPGTFDWDGLGAHDLVAGTTRTLLTPAALSDLLGGREGWISAVVSVGDDAGRLVANVASKPVEASSEVFSRSGYAVRHALCGVDLRAPALREITRLSSPFL